MARYVQRVFFFGFPKLFDVLGFLCGRTLCAKIFFFFLLTPFLRPSFEKIFRMHSGRKKEWS
jgi:hypothetical protein